MRPRLDASPPRLFDLTGRASVAVHGKDAAALLQGLLTNDVKGLAPGGGCHAALLTPKGKMVADLVALREEERFVLDAEPPLAPVLARALPGYVFFQEVAISDETEATAVLHVEGLGAGEALARACLHVLPASPHAHAAVEVAGRFVRVVRESRGGAEGFDLRTPRAHAADLGAALRSAGIEEAPAEVLEASRIEAGIPRWGAELGESVLPNEALLERDAISYTKGCYVGQEIVARLRTYGHVNRLLVRLELAPGAEAAPGDAVHAAEAPAGSVTSVARGSGAALAFIRREHAAEGNALLVRGETATVHLLA